MKRRSVLSSMSILGAALAVSFVVPACVGDDPAVSGETPDAGLSTDDAGGGGTDVHDGSALDAPEPLEAGDDAATVTCQDFESACSGVCVDLTSAKTDCGACGHDCGGGACIDSICQPVVVRDGLNHPLFDIDEQNVYFSNAEKVLACPLGGCAGKQPRQVGVAPDTIDKPPSGTLRVGGGNLVFFAPSSDAKHTYLYQCPTATGCATPPNNIASNGLQSFGGAVVAHGDDIYWNLYRQVSHVSCTPAGACTAAETIYGSGTYADGLIAADDASVYFTATADSKVILSCPKSGTGCVPTTIGTFAKNITQLAAQGSKVWILSTGGDGYTDGSIRSCPTNDPTCSGTLFADKLPYPTAFTVDDSAVTWLNRDGYGGKPEIVTCPISGCAGGPRMLATVGADAGRLRSDERFVYWATDTQIVRVAK